MKTAYIKYIVALLLFGSNGVVAVFVGLRQGFAFAAGIRSAEWLPILWLGLINTGAGCYCYFSSIGKLPVHTVSICGYLEPLYPLYASNALLHNRNLSPNHRYITENADNFKKKVLAIFRGI